MGKFDLGAILAAQAVTPGNQERTIETITGEILQLKQDAGRAILEIGQRLIEAKAMLDHGEWLPWLNEKVEFSERTAQNFMRLSREFSNPQTLADLGYSKALVLLALPDAEREQFVVENNVVDMSARQLEKAIQEREQALAGKKAAEEAQAKLQQDMKLANELLETAELDLSQTREREAALLAQLEELRSAPKEVAVMSVDQEQLEKARAEAAAEIQAELEKVRAASAEAEEKHKTALQAAAEALAAANAKLEKASQEQKQAAIAADPEMAKFEVYFNQSRENANKMRGLLLKARSREDQTTAEKLSKAILALVDVIRRAAE